MSKPKLHVSARYDGEAVIKGYNRGGTYVIRVYQGMDKMVIIMPIVSNIDGSNITYNSLDEFFENWSEISPVR